MIKASKILESYQIELVDKLEDLLDKFYKDLLDRGFKLRTAERHIANTELFLIEYHAFYYLEEISTLCPKKIYDFLGVWYFQRIHDPAIKDLLGILISLKKFFSFAAIHGVLPRSSCNTLKTVCCDKEYFLRRFRQYEHNPDLCFLPNPSSRSSSKTSLREYANHVPRQDVDDLILDALNNEDSGLSLQEMIEHMMRRFSVFEPRNNVISLKPLLDPGSLPSDDTDNQSSPQNPTIKTLKDHCMTLHRTNLVFMRWLDRYNCRIGEFPTDAIAACLDCDSLLVSLLAQLNVELISGEEIKLGHKLLDLMDKMLWKARYQITQSLGLDLRSLHL